MHSLYNRVAGQSVERIAALSDGFFAVAMTLLVLDLRVPAAKAIHSEHDPHDASPSEAAEKLEILDFGWRSASIAAKGILSRMRLQPLRLTSCVTKEKVPVAIGLRQSIEK